MKKFLLALIPVLMAASLFAYDFDWDGEFRTRAAIYNRADGEPGGHIDNRLQLGLKSELVSGLTLRAKFEIGQNGGFQNMVWGENGGGISTNGINVKTNEAYIEYRINTIKSNVRIGQQYWADHRGLVLDDTFSGISIGTEMPGGFTGMFGYGKYAEGNFWNRSDDMQGFMFSLDTVTPMEAGLQGYLSWTRINPVTTDPKLLKFISIQPYATIQMDPISIDGVLFVQSNDSYNPVNQKVEGDLTFGAALKADIDIAALEVAGDVLYISENGLNTLSNYYQNGLYLFGMGEFHDWLGLWWGASGNDDYLGLTAQAKYEIKPGMKLFGAAGMVLNTGMEVNGGLEMCLVPDLLILAMYGAYGLLDDDVNDKDSYALGSTIKLTF